MRIGGFERIPVMTDFDDQQALRIQMRASLFENTSRGVQSIVA